MVPVIAFLFLIGISLAVVFRLAADNWDRERVREYIESRGGQVHCIKWTPFGPGWFGSEHTRVYHVNHTDAEGFEHDAFVKTNLFAGVYFTEDTIVCSYDDQTLADTDADADADLRTENEALRAEIDRLRHERA